MDAKEEQTEALLRLLDADLTTLFSLTFTYRKPVPEGNIRAAATILRRWLVDGDLRRLSGLLKAPISMPVLDTAPIVESISKNHDVDFFLAAGIRMNGVLVQGIYHSQLEPHEVATRTRLPMEGKELPLNKFLSQPRHYFRGTWFSLDQEIRYVANKLGGNHYDVRRDDFHAALDESSRFMRYGGPEDINPGSELYLILEPDSTEVIAGVHLEIIAAAASLIQMKIGEEPLMEINTKRPNRVFDFQRWFRRPKPLVLLDFAERHDDDRET